MSRALVTIRSSADRARIANWASKVPEGTRVEFKETKRSVPQNDLMWGMLTDVSRQLLWHGQKLTPDDWKLIFLDGLKGEVRTVPNLDGNGLVSLRRSSDLSKDEMSQLIELIAAFGVEHGVEFGDQQERAA